MSVLKLLPSIGVKAASALKSPQTLVRGTEFESGALNKFLIKLNQNIFSLGIFNTLAITLFFLAVGFHQHEDRREFDKVFCTLERRWGDAWKREEYLTKYQKYMAAMADVHHSRNLFE